MGKKVSDSADITSNDVRGDGSVGEWKKPVIFQVVQAQIKK